MKRIPIDAGGIPVRAEIRTRGLRKARTSSQETYMPKLECLVTRASCDTFVVRLIP